jgi:hypothetical protein
MGFIGRILVGDGGFGKEEDWAWLFDSVLGNDGGQGWAQGGVLNVEEASSQDEGMAEEFRLTWCWMADSCVAFASGTCTSRSSSEPLDGRS